MVIKEALAKLMEVGTRRDSELLLSHITGLDILLLTLERSKELSMAQEKMVFEFYERKKSGEPVQYITGVCEFMSLEFLVNKNVLIPRSDTETLAEYAIETIGDKSNSVLDIGTGSGCIGISIAKYCPKAKVTVLDISGKALETAKANAEKNNVNIEFLEMDILSDMPNKKFDMIVSNPPYIRPEVIEGLECNVKDFEPYGALFGGDDGLLFYRRITELLPNILADNGELAFEIGYDQGADVLELVSKYFAECAIIKDLCGNDRVIYGKMPLF